MKFLTTVHLVLSHIPITLLMSATSIFRNIKNISIYGISRMISAGIPFLVLPYVTAILQPEDYAIVRLISVYALILIPLINWGTLDLISMNFHRKSLVEYKKVLSTLLILYLRNALIISALIFLIPQSWIQLTQISREWLLISVLLAFLVIIFESLNSLWISQKEAFKSALISIVKSVLEVVFILLLLKAFGWQGRIMAWLFSAFIIALFALVYLFRKQYLLPVFSREIKKSSIRFGYPLIAQRLAYFVLNQSDILFITHMISLKMAGVYGLGYQIGSMIFILNASIYAVYSPKIYEELSAGKKNTNSKFKVFYIVSISVASLLLMLFAPLLLSYFNPEYVESVNVIRWIAAASLMWSAYHIFYPYFMFYEHTKFIGMCSIGLALLNLILNYFLIDYFGYMGAAYATFISYGAYFLIGLLFYIFKIKNR